MKIFFFKPLFIKYSSIINNLQYFLVEFRWLYYYIIVILLFILSIDLYLLLNITDNYESINTNICNYCINNFDYIKSNDNLFGKILDLFSNKGENSKNTKYIGYYRDSFPKYYSNDALNNLEESKIMYMLNFRYEVKRECEEEFVKILENIKISIKF